MDTLDKINIAYTAPYAVCNIVSPRAAWEPIMPEMVKSDQSCKLLRLCGTLNAATLAASWAVKDADAETKRKMDLVTGGTYLGLGACISQFDADTDFGEKFGKPMKFVNLASQLTIGGLFIKRAMDAKNGCYHYQSRKRMRTTLLSRAVVVIIKSNPCCHKLATHGVIGDANSRHPRIDALR